MQFLSYLINGISLGSVYALIALGYTMVYGIAKMLNFAHGDVIMIGSYVVFFAFGSAGMNPVLAIVLSMVVCTVLGVTIERVAYRPLREAPSLAVLITAIGVSYLLQQVAQLAWTSNPKSFTSVVSGLKPISLFGGQLTISAETVVTIIAWAAMAVGFATALGAAFPFFAGDTMKNLIAAVLIGGLTIMNIAGVKISKILNNLMTISKLVPLCVFIAVGLFFVNGSNFTPFVPTHMADGAFANAAITMFFAYTGFEAIAVAAEDFKDPKKDLPRGIILTMIIVTIIYMLVVGISIGILGPDLAVDKAPIQTAFGRAVGPVGAYFILLGTLFSMGGINLAESFIAPRACTSLAEDGMLPAFLNRRTSWGTPWASSVVVAILSILLAWSGSFTTLAAISAVSRFTQYLPTVLSVIVFRRKWKDRERTYKIPGGIFVPVVAFLTSLWMLSNAKPMQLVWGLGGILVIAPYYLVYKKKKAEGLVKDHDEEA